MKKFLIGIIIIIAILWGILQGFMVYNSQAILYNQASFEIYLDNTLDINEYFKLTKDTFDIKKHKIVCLLPVDISGFKPNSAIVKTSINNIDCSATFEKGKYIKYEPYELKGTTFVVMVVNKNASLMLLDSPLGKKLILGQNTLSYNYKKGEINRLVISKNGLSEYCK